MQGTLYVVGQTRLQDSLSLAQFIRQTSLASATRRTSLLAVPAVADATPESARMNTTIVVHFIETSDAVQSADTIISNKSSQPATQIAVMLDNHDTGFAKVN
jgi:hypothetical protein